MDNNELYHFGIKGMKWGVRRYRNEDGSLTAKGKKKYSKQYEKLSAKVRRDIQKTSNSRFLNSYNKAASYMSSGGIDKFNKAQEKKYGKDYTNRDGYTSDYTKEFDKVYSKYYMEDYYNFVKNNKNYKKADDLVKKYNMTSWDNLAKENNDGLNDIAKKYSLK